MAVGKNESNSTTISHNHVIWSVSYHFYRLIYYMSKSHATRYLPDLELSPFLYWLLLYSLLQHNITNQDYVIGLC